LARERLRRGELPRVPASLVVAALPVRDVPCALCGDPITGVVEVRATFADRGVLHFHGRCHWAWDVERDAPPP
jgi:hypothetical protein